MPGTLVWLAAMLWRASRRRERRRLAGVSRVLAVFPHPDDETVACGGTLRRLAQLHRDVTLLVLTSGELGAGAGVPKGELAARRRAETRDAAAHLGVSRLLHWELPDGGLADSRAELRDRLQSLLAELRPGLVLTYGPDGLYGHPDHVVCSQLVTETCARARPEPRLWYVAIPRRLRRALVRLGSLPELDGAAPAPTLCVFVWPSLVSRIRAWRAHRSQRRAIGAGAARLLPGWLLPALQPWECFHEVAAR